MAQIVAQVTTADAPLNLSTQAAAGGGDYFATTGREIFVITNGGGSPITVTFAHQNQCNQGFSHDSAQSIAAGATRYLGPFDRFRFGDSSGNVQVTYSAVTSVTVAVTRSA